MKISNLHSVKGILLVLLICIVLYLITSSVISWSIVKYDQKGSKQPLVSNNTTSIIDPDSPGFKRNDKAIFDFTGDTVLILGPGIDYEYDENKYWHVQYKDEYEKIVKIDLPEEALVLLRDTIHH